MKDVKKNLVDGDEYEAAISDPVNQFSKPISKHMNEDHSDQIIKLVKHYAGITVQKATMQSIDRLGMIVVCERDGQQFKCRLGFPQEISSRPQAREAIVAMTNAAYAEPTQTQ
eukprot:TRINITY_DN9323_c0_g4_i2.p1 TRINITY_DN9323_c0_g4~~TRINITY_DN9323_c0_g4_i2.p1  ORF type:complete len:113 (+),score=15.43 TRINITY_DN9323_c0_g4_i2:130-468(+)